VSQSQKQAREYAEILSAFARGEMVQIKINNEWCNLVDSTWDFSCNKYRIAPKPIEEWRWLFPNGVTSSAYPNKDYLLDIFHPHQKGRPVLMREVTE